MAINRGRLLKQRDYVRRKRHLSYLELMVPQHAKEGLFYGQ
ncbi:hypothetical protein [Acetomicrobium sp.]|nr:hypothetical protein [Acetomicrobium sp.]